MADNSQKYEINYCINHFDGPEVEYVSYADDIGIEHIGKPDSRGIEYIQFRENNKENKPVSGRIFTCRGLSPYEEHETLVYDQETILEGTRYSGKYTDNEGDQKREHVLAWMQKNNIEHVVRSRRGKYYVFNMNKDIIVDDVDRKWVQRAPELVEAKNVRWTDLRT